MTAQGADMERYTGYIAVEHYYVSHTNLYRRYTLISFMTLRWRRALFHIFTYFTLSIVVAVPLVTKTAVIFEHQ